MNRNINEQEYLVQKIRTRYTEKQHTELDELKTLDRRVKRPANIFAYSCGSLSALIMGFGMSLIMTDLGATLGIASPLLPGLVLGILGLLMACVNYPIYKGMLEARRKKHACEIIELSDRIMRR